MRTLPERAALPLERALPEHDESAERLSVLADLGAGTRNLVVIGSLLAFVQRTLGPEQLRGRADERSGRGADRAAHPARAPRRRRLRAERRGDRDRRVRAPRRPHRRMAAGWRRSGAHRAVRGRGRVDPQLRRDDPGLAPASGGDRPRARLRVPAGRWLGGGRGACRCGDRPAGGGCRAAGAGRDRGGRRDVGGRPHRRGRRRSRGGTAHAVLTDLDELRALAADLDRQAADRLDGLVAAGELPRRVARSVRRARHPRGPGGAGRRGARGAGGGRRRLPRGAADPRPGRPGRHVAHGAGGRPPGGRQHRPGQPGGRAARRGGPPDDAGRRAPRGTGGRRGGAGPRFPERGVRARAQRPARPDRPRAVRRDAGAAADERQARGDARPHRQARAGRPRRPRRPRHRPLRRDDPADVRRATSRNISSSTSPGRTRSSCRPTRSGASPDTPAVPRRH